MDLTPRHLVYYRLAGLAACAIVAAPGLGVSVAPAADRASEFVLPVGEVSTVVVPGIDNAIKVLLPTNYVAEQKWPAIFYYSAMNQRPDTGILRLFTGSRDYILVGLPYLADNMNQSTPQAREAALQREITGFRASRAWVATHTAMDDRRVFLAGASKGGWMTASLGERECGRLAGLVILLSGRVPYAQQAAMAAPLQGKPVYIGEGETDPNLIPALEAREYYRRNGANVTTEIFDGIGHALPKHAPRLKQWLEAHGRYGDAAAAQNLAELTASFRDQAARIGTERDPAAKYTQLTDVLQNPLLALCSPASIPGLESQLAALRAKLPAQQAEWQAEQSFCEILWREMNLRRLADQKAVRDDLKKLSESKPDTRYGKLAADLYARVAAAYEKSVEATGQAAAAAQKATPAKPATTVVTPSFPSVDPVGPPVMRQKGRTISFQ